MVVVADGTREADEKLQRVLTCDPGLGVVRHADAGYPDAIDTARRQRHRHAERLEDRDNDDSGASVPRAARAGRARRHRRAASRAFRSCSAAAAPGGRRCCCGCAICSDATRASTSTSSASRRRRSGCSRRSATCRRSPLQSGSRAVRTDATARAAFDATLAFLGTARAPGDAPATFLLDEFLELRTFESFPGLRSVLRDLIAALAASGNRFVLTSRYTARALRLLRDAPPQFEIIHVAPLGAAEIRATLPAGADVDRAATGLAEAEDDRARDELARLVQALSEGRPAYARMLVDTADGHGDARRRRSRQRARRAPRARRRPRRSLPLLLRAAPPPRARLRRAQGDPRGARRGRAADADRDRAAPAPHAGLDEGLPVLARGRRPHRLAPEALQLRRSDDAPLGAPALPPGAARRTTTSCARCTAT